MGILHFDISKANILIFDIPIHSAAIYNIFQIFHEQKERKSRDINGGVT